MNDVTDEECDDLVSLIEDAIFRTGTGLEAAFEAADKIIADGWRKQGGSHA